MRRAPGITIVLATALATTAAPSAANDAASAAAAASRPAEVDLPFRAGGNEPSWRLDVGPAETTLLTDFGQSRLVAPTPAPQAAGSTTTFVARTARGPMTVTIVDRPCMDAMSGMPHPRTVTVVVGEQSLSGCGGEPASLLHGEWTVVTIDGEAPVRGSSATLAFASDGSVSGHASCNRFRGEYTLSGEGLAIAPPAVTRMECDAPLMAQERAFLATLGDVRAFAIEPDGALRLEARDGRALRARRR